MPPVTPRSPETAYLADPAAYNNQQRQKQSPYKNTPELRTKRPKISTPKSPQVPPDTMPPQEQSLSEIQICSLLFLIPFS